MMAEVHKNQVDINEDNNSLHGEVEEHAGDIMVEQSEGIMEEQARAEEQAGGLEHAKTFAVTPSAVVLWDYAQEIMQDNMEYAQIHPHTPCPTHPPIQMLCHNKCLLILMVEDRCEAVIWLWQELSEIEHILGLEHI
ncbi:hypothetical protein BDR06DRAFT_1055129 [Suillus hirtellus]|nr:hypothetical protein BDR06DRAFT_1055129 [Suillus hirtellus]